MRGDRVGELAVIVDLGDRGDDLGRDLLVELDVILELGEHRARQRLGLDRVDRIVGDRLGLGRVIALGRQVAPDARARGAFDQHLDGAVGQLEQLQDAGERSGGENRIGRGIVVGGVLLRREQNRLVGLHDLFERADRLLAADEQRHDHVRENDDVAQRQNRIGVDGAGADGLAITGHGRSCLPPLGRQRWLAPSSKPSIADGARPLGVSVAAASDGESGGEPDLPSQGLTANVESFDAYRPPAKMAVGAPSFKHPRRPSRGPSSVALPPARLSRLFPRARNRCRAAAPCRRRLRVRSPPARPRRGRADRTWCRAECPP